jgi:mannitol-1-phosphate 5-dehydrogenase
VTFVGFGLGPIQAGLFLVEARRSGVFDRLVVAEVDKALVAAVRGVGGPGGGSIAVNVAHRDGIERLRIDGVELLDPAVSADRRRLVAAAASAPELATAVPSVAFYGRGGAAGPAAILADAFAGGGPRVVYTAENDTRAAGKLAAAIAAAQPQQPLRSATGFQPLDTVIGKMSGVVTDPAEIAEAGLLPIVPGTGRAVLVEEFSHILVSRVNLPGFCRGLSCFEEKDDLGPFEEAKLYGHNAIHCLLAFLARRRGLALMSDAAADAGLMGFAREAFLLESGAGLRARYGAGGDPLFTERGFAAWAEDLLGRMVNPWLRDRVERVGRDPGRKLGWDDRLFGAMRLAIAAGARPVRLAAGARAGLELLADRALDGPAIRGILADVWGGGRTGRAGDDAAEECVRLVIEARVPEVRR